MLALWPYEAADSLDAATEVRISLALTRSHACRAQILVGRVAIESYFPQAGSQRSMCGQDVVIGFVMGFGLQHAIEGIPSRASGAGVITCCWHPQAYSLPGFESGPGIPSQPI